MSDALNRLLRIMASLRDPETGCPWDLDQDFKTIAPYTIEEAYEVAEAIEQEDWDELRKELGDLLFQVVFHSRMAEEAGYFSFEQVAAAIADKMEARHPHVFANADGGMDDERWEAMKAREREDAGATSAMDGVATALPALLRADKLQKRAAREGFDWPDTDGPRAKLAEEIEELDEAGPEERFEEAGDVLFAAVNLVRAYGIAPEDALRAANRKFERRFRAMEKRAGGSLKGLSLEAQEEHWQAVKDEE